MTTSTTLQTITLPNIIIKVILEYLLNRVVEFDYLIDFIHRYTLISKKWNEEIIGKLKVNNSLTTTSCNYELINKWNRLADRYKVDYEVQLEVYKKTIENSEIRDRVVSIRNSIGLFTKDDYNYYKNIRDISLKIKISIHEFEHDLPLLIDYSKRVNHELTLFSDFSYPKLSEKVSETFFNQSIFKSLSLSYFTISEMNHHNELSLLQQLNLFSVVVSVDSLSSILSRSPNLFKLVLNEIDIADGDYNIVLKLISNVSLKYQKLNHLLIHSNKYTVSYSSFVDLINTIKCQNVDFRIVIESPEQNQLVIDNTSIEKFRIILEQNYSKIDIFSIWKDKSNLRDIYLSTGVSIEDMNKLISLDTLHFHDDKMVSQVKIASLRELKTKTCPIHTIKIILQNNIGITKLDVFIMSAKKLAKILDSKSFPTLTSLVIKYVHPAERDINVDALLSLFQNNRNLQYISIQNCKSISLKNPQEFVMSILQVNSILISFIVHFNFTTNEDKIEDNIDFNLLDTIFSNNRTIQKLLLPSTISNDVNIIYSQKLINIFNKHSVIRTTNVDDK
ncbi:hypothetical protein DLAC_04354 [Tieghemostelium lacteum]|uniref:F-box/LRR-repeat protein 15/At3g58940/PEG3-like LRR domain-containing protein n=1 Tax=Tieghemostelium lacteum TaxID=361077 RepID=A0A151ZJE3_TIELA|nr:hypothetical protein DLAC_04354 [Tieghemostelium lacteum]|eukprot:KYQ94076.1 hypothetical protein DLAC_04354 [Tieghemostelium lacteum]